MTTATAIDIKLPVLPDWVFISAIAVFAVVIGLVVFFAWKCHKPN